MSWYEAIKVAVQVAEKVKDAELHAAMGALRMEGARLAEENAKLRDENRELREKLATRDALEFRENFFWKGQEGPYCPRCYQEHGKASRMTEHRGRYINDYYKCPVCELKLQDPHGTPVEQAPVRRTRGLL